MTKVLQVIIFNIHYKSWLQTLAPSLIGFTFETKTLRRRWRGTILNKECVMSTDTFDITILSSALIGKKRCYPKKMRTPWHCAF